MTHMPVGEQRDRRRRGAPDGLRTTPRRLRHRDAEVFPEAHAAALRQGAPHAYHLEVGPAHVTITHDGFYLPEARAAELHAQYAAYVDAWRRAPRDFPRAGVGYGGFRDLCRVVVRRADAPGWIRRFRDLAAECYDPFQREHTRGRPEPPA
jgi:hypothetical protein